MWFMYLLYFLTYVVGLGSGKASFALLSGQIADGIATNVVGLMIDKTSTRIGKNKPWYIIGFLIVLPSFILTFNTCVFCDLFCDHVKNRPTCTGLETAYFMILPALFNVGWAAVQISTMAIVVILSLSQARRDRLISLRNGFTYVSNLFTLVLAIILILTVPEQIWTFRLLAWSITAIGVPLSLFFIFSVPESKLAKEAIKYDKEYRKANGEENEDMIEEGESESQTDPSKAKTWKDWLIDGAFYVHALVYTFTRMAVNVTMTLTPFYLIHVLGYEHKKDEPAPPQIASVPLVSYT
jgi:Na+/melibiose symporter-like transporter